MLTALYRRLTWPVFVDAVKRTLLINCMIMLIVVGGTMFASVFRVQGGEKLVQAIVADLDIGTYGILLICLAIVFAAGFILDWVSIVLICLPIFMPIIAALKIDPCVVRGADGGGDPDLVPDATHGAVDLLPEIDRTARSPTATWCAGVMPYVIAQIVTLLAVMFVPWLATYLPSQLKGF